MGEIGNAAWLADHPNTLLINYPIIDSDHGAMLLHTAKPKRYERRPYRFEAMWTTHPQCEKVIQQAWQTNDSGLDAFKLVRKLNVAR